MVAPGFPTVFYHGKHNYTGPRTLQELIKAPFELTEQLLLKPFHLIDTHEIDDEELYKQPMAGLMAYIMKHIYREDIQYIVQSRMKILKKLEEEGASDFVVLLINYLLNTGETKNPKAFVDTIRKDLSVGGKIMTAAEWFRNEGLVQGQAEGQYTMLLQLLQSKFGAVPTKYKKYLEQANSQQLMLWGKRMLSSPTLKALFEEKETI